MAIALAIAALGSCASGASCSDEERSTTPEPVLRPAPSLRIVVLTDLKGYLEPCGCTSRPLGGIDKTAALVRALRDEGPPVLVVAAGDLFFSGASHGAVAGAETQDRWKAEALVSILDRIGVDAATPGRLDFSQGLEPFAALAAQARFPLLAAGLEVSAAEGGEAGGPLLGGGVLREVGGVKVGILGVSDLTGAEGEPPEGVSRRAGVAEAAAAAAAALRAEGAEVLLALVRGDRRLPREVARAVEGLDFVVQGGLDLEAPLVPFEAGGAWVLHAGRQGQGLVVVDLFRRGAGAAGGFADWSDWTREARRAHLAQQIADLRARLEAWEADDTVAAADLARQRERLGALEGELRAVRTPREVPGDAFAARYVELPPEAPGAPEIGAIMERHFRRVNGHNREVFADLAPKPLPEGQAGYTGSAACQPCHEAEHAWWTGTKHGRAYPTLVDRHKQYNLDCVGCHVTGYMEPGGSTVTHLGGGALENVGCEACHGPGSLHVEDPEVGVLVDPPEGLCVQCHNAEHSDRFEYRAYRAMLLAPGHGLPTAEEQAQGAAR